MGPLGPAVVDAVRESMGDPLEVVSWSMVGFVAA
jgi:hypothetical protein